MIELVHIGAMSPLVSGAALYILLWCGIGIVLHELVRRR